MWVSAGSAQQESMILISLFLQKRITQTCLKDTSCSAVWFRVHLPLSCSCGEVQFNSKPLTCIRTYEPSVRLHMSSLGALIRKVLLQYIKIQVQLSNTNANHSASN